MAYKLESGTHDVEITHGGFSVTAKGTGGIKVRFADIAGGYIDHVMWCTEKKIPWTTKDLNTLGVNVAEMTPGEFRDIGKRLVQARARIVVEDEEYQGKWTPKVKWINEPEPEVDDSAISRMYGLLTGRGAPVMAAPVAPATGYDQVMDEDVPF